MRCGEGQKSQEAEPHRRICPSWTKPHAGVAVGQRCPFDTPYGRRAGLEIEVRSTSLHRTQDGVGIHPAGCDFGNTEGDYTLAGCYWQAKGDGKRADLQSA